MAVRDEDVEELFALTKRNEVVFRTLQVKEEGLAEETLQKIALMAPVHVESERDREGDEER